MSAAEPIKIAILAMGGEGGGVLADWIVELAEHNGYIAQATSVPGVAQRTGATIYYVELYPRALAERDGADPVLALMPLPGDVDVVLASELMEAGRAVQRGLVTPDRTTLIASTHRVYSIAEKTALGDGRADSANLLAHAQRAAKHFVRFDVAEAAEQAGSVISAVLFGALAGTGVLPFSRAQFEATIAGGGVGVKPSLQAFATGYERAGIDPDAQPMTEPVAPVAARVPVTVTPRDPQIRALIERIDSAFPAGARSMLQESARHLALWMSYEDTIRVAELKTRGTRFERVRGEVRVTDDQLLAIHEFMHPRVEEICDTLPAGLGRWLAGSGWPRRLAERFTRKGRVVATSSLGGFLMLYLVAGMKRWRRGTLRYAAETQQIERWLAHIEQAAVFNPRLAVEVAQCQRLVKGYGDTHAHGLRNFESVMAAVQRAGAALAPATLRELRDAALADENGDQLRRALARHALAGTRNEQRSPE